MNSLDLCRKMFTESCRIRLIATLKLLELSVNERLLIKNYDSEVLGESP